MNTKTLFGILLALNVIAPAPAWAQYGFADGGFDSQGASITGYCYFNNPPGSCPTGPWTGSGSGFAHSENGDWGDPAAASLSTLSFLQLNGTLLQTFTATESHRVVLTWLEADRPWWGGQTYNATVNGTVIATFTSSKTYWSRRISVPFDIVAGSNYTIAFTGTTTTGDHSAFLDSVDLVDAQSITTYSYDALGRLRSSSTSGGVNDGLSTNYTLDPAGNRTNVQTTGAP
jgi:hypothetical protein